jgi:hypothetical protein
MSFESVHDLVDRASDYGGEQTPIVPSAKAIGKRKVDGTVDSDGERFVPALFQFEACRSRCICLCFVDPPRSDEFLDGRVSPFVDDSIEHNEEENQDGPDHRWKKPVKYVYDAAADRARELRRDLGIPAPVTNGSAR